MLMSTNGSAFDKRMVSRHTDLPRLLWRDLTKHAQHLEKSSFCLHWQHLPQPDGGSAFS